MSRTLFWYIMRDLLRIFLMTSFVLAGIMSFGGLIKPLMQYGLSGTQVGRMLLYMMPATQTYSLPIAALFATTMVYGRLSADNELIACRAAGISHLALATPAFVLGLVLSIASLALLSFVVPYSMLKVERVAFASLADIVQKNIQRTHQIKLQGHVIYAEDAEVMPRDPQAPDDEVVVLYHPMFCLQDYDERVKAHVPSEFYIAKKATVRIHQGGDQVEFWASLDGGVRVPSRMEGAAYAGIDTASFGPVLLPSPIKENTKFMTVQQLKELYRDPMRSREVRTLYADLLRQAQEGRFLANLVAELRNGQKVEFASASGETYTLALEGGLQRSAKSPRWRPLAAGRSKMTLTSAEGREIRLIRRRFAGADTEVAPTVDEAGELTLSVYSDIERQLMWIEFNLRDVLLGAEDARPARPAYTRPLTVPMPEDLKDLGKLSPSQFLRAKFVTRVDDVKKLQRKLSGLQTEIEAEIHGRSSFAVSCLILVLMGSALGMMFRTGNYLSAFALSSIPALLCIALIVTGQHVVENDPRNLKLGLGFIWSGNVIVLGLAVFLLGRLQRQ